MPATPQQRSAQGIATRVPSTTCAPPAALRRRHTDPAPPSSCRKRYTMRPVTAPVGSTRASGPSASGLPRPDVSPGLPSLRPRTAGKPREPTPMGGDFGDINDDAVAPPWSIHDFRGGYHLSYINGAVPVPGTQLRIERIRKTYLARKEDAVHRLAKEGVRRRQQLDIAYRGLKKVKDEIQESYGIGRQFTSVEVVNDAQREELDRIIEAGSNVDKETRYKFWRAVRQGDRFKIQLMCSQGFAALDMVDDRGETALVHAARAADYELVARLLDLGAYHGACDFSGSPAMLLAWKPFQMQASKLGRSEHARLTKLCRRLVLTFLAHGADPNSQQMHDGLTALHLCCRYNQQNLAAEIVTYGGDPTVCNKKGQDVFEFSCVHRRPEIARILANHTHVLTDARLSEFKKQWTSFLTTDQPLARTEPTEHLQERFRNEDRALAGRRKAKISLRVVKAADPLDSPPKLQKVARQLDVASAVVGALFKKGKQEGPGTASSKRPSSHRLDIYRASRVKAGDPDPEAAAMDRKLRENLAFESSAIARRRKVAAISIASKDITQHALKQKKHRPATRSLLFKRGRYPSQRVQTMQSRQAREDIKKQVELEQRRLLEASVRQKSATVNKQALLPPSSYQSFKGYSRVNAKAMRNTIAGLQPWKRSGGSGLLRKSTFSV